MANKKHAVISRPVARSERLLVEAVGDESVIYDQDSNIAHALTPVAAAVFTYATGDNTVAEIAELASYRLATTVTEREVSDAVEELSALALLDTHDFDIAGGGMSRRTALKVFGGAAAGTMLVSSVAAPFAAASTIDNNGSPYTCGTGADPITNNGGSALTWYQPYSDTSGDLVPPYYAGGPASSSTSHPSGVYDLGSPCCTNNAVCTYAYRDENGHNYSYTGSCVDNADITTGVCALGQNAQINGTKVGTTGSTASVVIGVPTSDCQTGHYVCATSAGTNVWQAVGSVHTGSGSCPSGQTKITLSSTDVIITTIDVTTACNQGTYQVVPCDGPTYQCAEVVCVPNGKTVTGAITGANSSPPNAAINDTDGVGYSNSTVGYTGLDYVDIGYQYKFCTPCTKTGKCS